MKTLVALMLAGALASGAAFAQGKGKSWDDDAKGKGKGKASRQAEKGKGAKKHFTTSHTTVITDWYAEEFRAGRCPPGLAKKRNGCMPPGQAKKWQVGQALPRDVVFYDLPPAIVVRIGVPPPGYKYVRVGADILMIAVGTAMVVDALTDLSRL